MKTHLSKYNLLAIFNKIFFPLHFYGRSLNMWQIFFKNYVTFIIDITTGAVCVYPNQVKAAKEALTQAGKPDIPIASGGF